ncbi:Na+/H+ antiporter subunit E [Pseudoalteromonas sp. SR44-5]|jgi:multicomponent K+:H+ antiporter subunit E|uniref:Na+/H+ antiporter subunit E n=2 Tax=Pseudoalteromonas TaxID=53246 RepID=A0ABY3FBQ8_9GAMM|nr:MULTISPECIES: Na+/H+ antiporter subunit E [Pseudoalteromonas]MBB1293726.1 Na+/H+ antiporter subunit E [Pseudoalteromonas sp. SR41-4]MBB1301244.1 Na+/H+ antiporter subunit E [Pseudoalteromonas sp. SR44-8]MBB1310335.1 Na+/H+ antiporter subunit E [Pseudoalteromonas sp. SR41-8]MBB1334516.1 Na+/H+ antiporter subunit E [Pseudoalteromonas sp. SR41-6]MBB1343845.1 Na+/H+ antiporter subunit E [Pseudoalteromonas sp. SR45-6]|tara:strand:- start:602 stop:1138 length:537 start_codon:yes stop_codon:yes gene_type:complete
MRLESRFRWLPTPFRSALLFVVWLLLNNSVSAGHIVLAVIFAILIPLVSFPFREPQPLIIKPGLALKQLIIVMYDIITANMQVALLILGPVKKLRPAFVKVPIELSHAMPITILASTVSLTPGTVSAEVYPIPESLAEGEQPTQRYLLIHVLDLDDEQALIDTIKQRYEAPLKEIFQC